MQRNPCILSKMQGFKVEKLRYAGSNEPRHRPRAGRDADQTLRAPTAQTPARPEQRNPRTIAAAAPALRLRRVGEHGDRSGARARTRVTARPTAPRTDRNSVRPPCAHGTRPQRRRGSRPGACSKEGAPIPVFQRLVSTFALKVNSADGIMFLTRCFTEPSLRTAREFRPNGQIAPVC